MANLFINDKANSRVSVRIDEVYLNSDKHLVTPYEADDGSKRFFGSLKFIKTKEVEKFLKDVVKELPQKARDDFFYGNYPKWVTDEYGSSLRVNGRAKFYTNFIDGIQIPEDEITDYIYSVELHFKISKNDELYIVLARAFATRKNMSYEDALFEDEELPF